MDYCRCSKLRQVASYIHGANVEGGDKLMSIYPTRLLLATDGSEDANLAAQATIELSKATGSEVHIAYVIPTMFLEERVLPRAGRGARPNVTEQGGGADEVGRRPGCRDLPQIGSPGQGDSQARRRTCRGNDRNG
jgi:hypothetical protein